MKDFTDHTEAINEANQNNWRCEVGWNGAVAHFFLVINDGDGIPFPDVTTCKLAAAAPRLLLACQTVMRSAARREIIDLKDIQAAIDTAVKVK